MFFYLPFEHHEDAAVPGPGRGPVRKADGGNRRRRMSLRLCAAASGADRPLRPLSPPQCGAGPPLHPRRDRLSGARRFRGLKHPTITAAMNILVACDSFKDALAADGGLPRHRGGPAHKAIPTPPSPKCRCRTAAKACWMCCARRWTCNGSKRPSPTHWAGTIKGRYGLSADRQTCVVEMAEASGLQRLTLAERDPRASLHLRHRPVAGRCQGARRHGAPSWPSAAAPPMTPASAPRRRWAGDFWTRTATPCRPMAGI